jgi:cytidylate kinase
MAVLTISRTYQSGGHEIGKAVARQTGFDFIDKDRIFSDLKSLGEKWGHAFEELDEVTPSLWEKNDWQYRGYIALIECIILDYARKDRVVLLGRGANFLLEGIPHVLRIRLVAPLEVRIERAIIKYETARETAELLIKKTDRDRAGYIRSIYKKNWEDPEHYDLVLNTADYSIEQLTRKITEALKEWDLRATSEGRKKLENMALTAEVKARIMTHPEIFIPTLEVSHDGNSIVLKGVVHTSKEFHLVEELVQKMAVPHPVRNELHYRK